MLVFLDESGDPNITKLGEGSSTYFVIGAVIFEDHKAAEACSRRIDGIREELRFARGEEFKFAKSSARTRQYFFEQICGYEFCYVAFVVNKGRVAQDCSLRFPVSLHQFAVRLLFENAGDFIKGASVCFDSCGGREFQEQLKNYLRLRLRDEGGDSPFKRIRSAKSHTNNLLQLADMICGAVARSFNLERRDRMDSRALIKHRERQVRIWP